MTRAELVTNLAYLLCRISVGSCRCGNQSRDPCGHWRAIGDQVLDYVKANVCPHLLAAGKKTEGYEISADGRMITCRRCNQTSYSPNDVANRYCGQCHVFHDDVARTDVALLNAAEHADG